MKTAILAMTLALLAASAAAETRCWQPDGAARSIAWTGYVDLEARNKPTSIIPSHHDGWLASARVGVDPRHVMAAGETYSATLIAPLPGGVTTMPNPGGTTDAEYAEHSAAVVCAVLRVTVATASDPEDGDRHYDLPVVIRRDR